MTVAQIGEVLGVSRSMIYRALRGQGYRFVGPTTAFALMCAVGMVDAHVTSSHMRGVCGLRDADGQLTEEGRRFVDEVTAPATAP
ncbi:DNA-3-methyladenine glycosylase I [Pseudoglutamicibacter albus]|uniref:Uncharacterized protein n=1 Tax=Pseudoglutamicibacter albus DNF00011 TaxID=1401063 RepID=A0A096AGS9_9MICC|nr:DNA-3-methyladenine glycosylase I [Pseudoglutamicibacter albus]KGF20164.1 hypothetical protein HMPREF2128_06705 [Pseudoglutamicibacter albus DNF00011]